MKKQIIGSIIGAALLIGLATTGIALHNNGVIFPDKVQAKQITLKNNQITYKGKNNKTALSLLQGITKVSMSGTGEMAYVTGISGVNADSSKNQFWAFNVNGKEATVGAGSYITKDTDTITWKLSTF